MNIWAIGIATAVFSLVYGGWRWYSNDELYTGKQHTAHLIGALIAIPIGFGVTTWYLHWIFHMEFPRQVADVLLGIGGFFAGDDGKQAFVALLVLLIIIRTPRSIRRLLLVMSDWVVVDPDGKRSPAWLYEHASAGRAAGKITFHRWLGEDVVDFHELQRYTDSIT